MEHEASLASLQEEKSALEAKYNLLAKTQEYLSKAKDSFVSRYMQPIMNGFKKYY